MEIVLVGLVVLAGVGYFAYTKFFRSDDSDSAPLTLSVGDIQELQTQAASTSGVDGVFVNFTGIEIQPAEGDRLVFTFDAKVINLMNNVGTDLLDGQEVPVGSYNWIRLAAVTADSYVQVGDVKEPLNIPSGEQSGLKLNRGFRVGENGADFTINFNLDKSLLNPGGKQGYKLKPVLNLIDNLAPEVPEEPVEPVA